MGEWVGYIGHCGFILDQPEYKHISHTQMPDGRWEQMVVAHCPVCGSKINVVSMLPGLLGTTKELIWRCGCSDEDCSTRYQSLLTRTDNPVKLSALDALIQQFIEEAKKSEGTGSVGYG